MRFLRRSLVGLLLSAITVALIAWAGHTVRSAVEARMAQGGAAPDGAERTFAVNVLRVESQGVIPVLETFGEVRSLRSLDLRVAQGGRVVSLAPGFQDGGTVVAGELVAATDPVEFESALQVAEADRAEAEAALAEAGRTLELAQEEVAAARAQESLRLSALERARDLLSRGAGSEAGVEAAELALSQAGQAVIARRSSLSQAEAGLDLSRTTLERRRIAVEDARRRLAETRIVAPFAGTLSEVAAVEGGLLSPGERIARLIDPTALEVAIRLSSEQFGRLLGPDGTLIPAAVEVALGAADGPAAAATITRDAGAVAEGETGRVVFARIDGAASGLLPGDFVSVRVAEPPLSDVAVLPAAALDGAMTVLALGPDDRLEAIAVEVLRRQGDSVIVPARDLDGREIVAERSPQLGAGIRVTPIRPGEAGDAAMIPLSPERRAALIAFVEASDAIPAEAKARVLAELAGDTVPAATVARIEARMGG